MAVVSEQDRTILQNISNKTVEKAMELFDQKFRKDFEETRWKKYTLLHNGQSYPPKDLLRCVIAVMNNSLYERNSVKGGGDSINKYFIKLGFDVVDSEKPSANMSKTKPSVWQEPASTPPAGEIPTRKDIEVAYRMIARLGQEVSMDDVLDQIEKNVIKEGRLLKDNWRVVMEEKFKSGQGI
jgi:hypothetical protein